MNKLICPFRLNVRLEDDKESADCGLIQQQRGVPGMPVVVERNTCEICCASSRSLAIANAVLPSLLFSACDAALLSNDAPTERLPHLQSLYQQAERQLLDQSENGRPERVHSCDAFLCC